MGIKIKLDKRTSVDKALKQLKRQLAREGVTKEVRKHRYYEKPSEVRRRKDKERIRNLRKAQRTQNMI